MLAGTSDGSLVLGVSFQVPCLHGVGEGKLLQLLPKVCPVARLVPPLWRLGGDSVAHACTRKGILGSGHGFLWISNGFRDVLLNAFRLLWSNIDS